MHAVKVARSLKVGDVLIYSIYLNNGQFLQAAGLPIKSQSIIDRLAEKGIDFVYIKDNPLDDAIISNANDQSEMEYNNSVEELKQTLLKVGDGRDGSINLNKIMVDGTKLMDNIIDNKRAIYKLDNEIGTSNSVYAHSLATAQYALTLARIVEKDRLDRHFDSKTDSTLRDFYATVTVSALLHNIGELCKDDPAMLKEARSGISDSMMLKMIEIRGEQIKSNPKILKQLTDQGINVKDDKIYKKIISLFVNSWFNKYIDDDLENGVNTKMPLYSYGIIKVSETEGISKAIQNLNVAESAILHQNDNLEHTNAFITIPYVDKAGHDTDTTVISQIIKIAADYDKKLKSSDVDVIDPSDVIDKMIKSDKYNKNYLYMFKSKIPPYEAGDIVILDNGLTGVVVSVNTDYLTMPTVAIYSETNGQFHYVNLAKEQVKIIGKKTHTENIENKTL